MLRWIPLLCCFIITSGLAAQEKDGGLTLSQLQAELTANINQEAFQKAIWGIKAVSLESGKTIFDVNSEKLLKPASTAKLFTAALALDALGPDYQIATSLYTSRKPENGVLSGDLIVFGRGDPTFSSGFEPATNIFRRIIDGVRRSGIRRITGDLIADSSYFNGSPFGTGWTWDDLQYYYGTEATAVAAADNSIDIQVRPGVEIGAPCKISTSATQGLVEIVNETSTGASQSETSLEAERRPGSNRVIVRGKLAKGAKPWTESLSVPDAPIWAATLLKADLVRAGIAIDGKVRAEPRTSDRLEIFRTGSPTIAAIVQKMLQVSQNTYAQLLLLHVGAQSKALHGESTEQLGINAMRQFASRAGVKKGELLLDDGAGLSRSGLVTPDAMVQLLRYMHKQRSAAVFREGLPQPGGEGTLHGRLDGLKGRIWAKTGTIRYVSSLAGYLKTLSGEEIAFCIMLNAYDAPERASARDQVDSVARLLARLNERTGAN